MTLVRKVLRQKPNRLGNSPPFMKPEYSVWCSHYTATESWARGIQSTPQTPRHYYPSVYEEVCKVVFSFKVSKWNVIFICDLRYECYMCLAFHRSDFRIHAPVKLWLATCWRLKTWRYLILNQMVLTIFRMWYTLTDFVNVTLICYHLFQIFGLWHVYNWAVAFPLLYTSITTFPCTLFMRYANVYCIFLAVVSMPIFCVSALRIFHRKWKYLYRRDAVSLYFNSDLVAGYGTRCSTHMPL
jgi:hypothetical protein